MALLVVVVTSFAPKLPPLVDVAICIFDTQNFNSFLPLSTFFNFSTGVFYKRDYFSIL